MAFRFGEFEFVPGANQLYRRGTRLPLERKPALLLRCLLENRGRVVTREQLFQVLWPDNTFVDFELGLRVAANKVRLLLGDSVDSPKYIETVVGVGYFWKAEVEVITEPESAPASPAMPPDSRSQEAEPAAAIPPAQPALLPAWLKSRRAAWLMLCVGILLLGMLASRSHSRIQFGSQDWVLVCAFDNRTGNTTLDGVLQPALERELNNSQFVHVTPREHVGDLLALMKRPVSEAVSESEGREICLRDGGIKLLLAGRAEKLGRNYVLSVNVEDPRTGQILHAASSDAAGEGEIPNAVHRIGDDLREALGEEVSQIQLTDRQLEKVTTPSFEALKLFTIGYRFQVEHDAARAQTFLEQAVQADPRFATAWVHLGWARFDTESPQYSGGNTAAGPHAMEAFRKARELADQVSERERLFILQSWYFANHNTDQALHFGELLVRLYPDHYWGANNQAFLLWNLHRNAEAVELERQCLRLRPQFQRVLHVAAMLGASDPAKSDEFLALALKMAENSKDPEAKFWVEYTRANERWRTRDASQLEALLSQMNPSAPMDYYRKAAGYALLGELRMAQRVAQNSTGTEDLELYAAFLRHGDAGVREYATQHPLPPLQPSKSDPLLLYVIAAPEPERERALELSHRVLGQQFQGLWNEAVDGERDLQAHDYAGAIQQIEASLADAEKAPVTFGPIAAGLLWNSLAEAYEHTGNNRRALQALQNYSDLIDGDDLELSWALMWPLVERHRADLYRKIGDTAKAEAIEQKLSALLSHADPDYSISPTSRESSKTADSAAQVSKAN